MTDTDDDLPELTSEAYARWLRAQRPPLAMFLGLSALEQEALAQLGDEHLQDFATAIGVAVGSPQAASDGLGMAQGDAGAEESVLRRMVGEIAAHIAKRGNGEAPRPAPKMSPKPAASDVLVPTRQKP